MILTARKECRHVVLRIVSSVLPISVDPDRIIPNKYVVETRRAKEIRIVKMPLVLIKGTDHSAEAKAHSTKKNLQPFNNDAS